MEEYLKSLDEIIEQGEEINSILSEIITSQEECIKTISNINSSLR